jgi:hypothetical protein
MTWRQIPLIGCMIFHDAPRFNTGDPAEKWGRPEFAFDEETAISYRTKRRGLLIENRLAATNSDRPHRF